MPRILLKKSRDGKHKYTAFFVDEKYPKYHGRKVHFGASGYEDFTSHGDIERKKRYIARHSNNNENWNKSGLLTAGFWSRWILWNKKTVAESVASLNKKFQIHVVLLT
jgi:hypothetical protein